MDVFVCMYLSFYAYMCVMYVFLCLWISVVIDVLPLCGRLILDVVMKL